MTDMRDPETVETPIGWVDLQRVRANARKGR